jgi:hypothetical protein
MTFEIEIMLRNDARVFTETLAYDVAEATWTDRDVEIVLLRILGAIDQRVNPEGAHGRTPSLRGITWIVHTGPAGHVLALEIHSASAVAGPFDLPADRLEAMVARVMKGASPAHVVH